MAIKLVSIKCPDCNAILDIEEGREQVFCMCCGSKINMRNKNLHIYHHVDKIELSIAEAERKVKMNDLEFEENRIVSAEKRNRKSLIKSVILMIIGIILFYFNYINVMSSIYVYGEPSIFYVLICIGCLLWIISEGKNILSICNPSILNKKST